MKIEAGAPFILDGYEYEVRELVERFGRNSGKKYVDVAIDLPPLAFPPALPKDAGPEAITERKAAITEMIKEQRRGFPVRDIHCDGAEVLLGEPQDIMSLAREQAAQLVRGKPVMADWAFTVAIPFMEARFKDRDKPFFYLPGRVLPRHPDRAPITGAVVKE